MAPLIRLDFEKPGRDGRLYIGFAKTPKGFVRDALANGTPLPLESRAWYNRSPLLKLYCHDKATFPSGLFSEAISGARGVKPTKEQIIGFIQYVRNWLGEMHKLAPIVAAWGWSGALPKHKPDPQFAAAWVDVMASLGKNKDQTLDRRPEQALQKALKELSAKDAARGAEVLELRKAVWGGKL